MASVCLDSFGRGPSLIRWWLEEGRGLVGLICGATFSITCSHTRSLNPVFGGTDAAETSPATSCTVFLSPRFTPLLRSHSCFFLFFRTGSSRAVVALGWTHPFGFVSISQWRGEGGLALSHDRSSGRHQGFGATNL